MNHLELGALESAALEPTNGELWLDKLENALGYDLDGDQMEDGYSLDLCNEMYECELTYLQAAGIIRWLKDVADHTKKITP